MKTSTNEKIKNWIITKAEKEYADDISIILAYGSYINGTANDKSDIDCYFIPKTDRGYEFGVDFILNHIGYDVFPMSWERVENIADLKEVLLPCVGDVKVLFYSAEEDLARFKKLQEKMKNNLQDREYAGSIAKERYESACCLYSRMKLCKDLSETRMYAGYIIMKLADSIAAFNQDYFHYGLKRQYEDLQNFEKLPEGFLDGYLNVIKAEELEESIHLCYSILKSVSEYTGWEMEMGQSAEPEETGDNQKQPDYAGLAGLYEEISSTFNKIYVCSENENPILAFLSAVCLQYELSETALEQGIPYYDILSSYSYHNLTGLADAAKKAEDDLVQLIENGGGIIKRFSNYEEFEMAGL